MTHEEYLEFHRRTHYKGIEQRFEELERLLADDADIDSDQDDALAKAVKKINRVHKELHKLREELDQDSWGYLCGCNWLKLDQFLTLKYGREWERFTPTIEIHLTEEQ